MHVNEWIHGTMKIMVTSEHLYSTCTCIVTHAYTMYVYVNTHTHTHTHTPTSLKWWVNWVPFWGTKRFCSTVTIACMEWRHERKCIIIIICMYISTYHIIILYTSILYTLILLQWMGGRGRSTTALRHYTDSVMPRLTQKCNNQCV